MILGVAGSIPASHPDGRGMSRPFFLHTPPTTRGFYNSGFLGWHCSRWLEAVMGAVVQLVEHQVVILGVAGSSPVSHPKDKNQV